MNVLFVSLGCDKNLVDTEVMLGLLASRGHQMVDSEDMADVIVVNTCCFIIDSCVSGGVRIILRRNAEKRTFIADCYARSYGHGVNLLVLRILSAGQKKGKAIQKST